MHAWTLLPCSYGSLGEWGDLFNHFESSHSVTLIRKLQFLREVVWEHDVLYKGVGICEEREGGRVILLLCR